MASSSSTPTTPPRRPAKRDTSSYNLSALTALSGPGPSGSGSAIGSSLRPTAAAGTARVQQQDPVIERALQLSTFEASYSTEEFVGTLSEKIIAESKADPGPFNPKPFLQTFSPALDTLLALRQQVAERTKKMETEVRRAEREYGRRLRELDGGFEAIGGSFSNLESKITDVGRTAVRIGEQLESLHQTRSTAQSTSLLLSYYLSLAHQTSTTSPDVNNPSGASSTPLEALFATRTSREGRSRLAIILRRLMAVAKDVADQAGTALTEAEAQATPNLNHNPNGEPEAAAGGGGGGGGINQKMIIRRKKEKEKAERVRDEIEKYGERFEKEVLRLFDRSYRKGDPRMMAHCAKTLQDFNGGASCVQIYVNQHDFFISKDRLLEEAVKEPEDGQKHSDLWSTIGDPDAPGPTSEPGMQALLKEVRITVSQEAQIVKAVFPNPGSVLQVFLQRVFAQVIQQHLENLISRATTISTLAVLRILHLTHSLCSSLVDDLKVYDLTLSSGSATPGANSVKSPGGAAGAGAGSGGPLAVMLDQALEEIFVPWLEGTRYLDSETKNLVELYAGLLSRFTRYHETVLKAKPNSLLDKVVNQLSTSSSAATTSSTAQTAAAAISKYANLFTSSASTAAKNIASPTIPNNNHNTTAAAVTHPKPVPPHLRAVGGVGGSETPRLGSGMMTPGLQRQDSMRDLAGVGAGVNKGLEEKVWSTDGVLTVDMSERMLRWHAEAVGRVVELSPSGDVARNALALSKTLAEAIGRSFVETALDSALSKLDSHETRSEPDLSQLSVLKPTDLITHLWQRYTATALLPLTGSGQATAVRREMINFNSHNVVRMEGKINNVIQKAIDSIVAWLNFLLTKQKKNDYKPKNDELSFARTNTEPCSLICEFLETVREASKESLSGKNAEGFLTEVGVAFHSLLLDHYKRFPVNPTGGLMLTKDLATYQEIMTTYSIPAINDRFDMLRQLGNSFIVQPNVLQSYMTESHLGRIDSRYLRPYLQQRSDWSQFSRTLPLQLSTSLDDDPISNSTPHSPLSQTPSQNHTSSLGLGKFRSGIGSGAGSRLSTMSGVASTGMGKLKEMLKEFETLSPEEADAVRKANQNRAAGVGGAGAGGERPRAGQLSYGQSHAGFFIGV